MAFVHLTLAHCKVKIKVMHILTANIRNSDREREQTLLLLHYHWTLIYFVHGAIIIINLLYKSADDITFLSPSISIYHLRMSIYTSGVELLNIGLG